MRKSVLLLVAIVGILFVVPAHVKAAALQPGEHSSSWRTTATENDRARIRGWRRTWMEGLDAARRGHAQDVAREGALLEPDAGMLEPAPPPGYYRCRTIKLGAAREGGLDWVTYPEFRCRISREGEVLHFIKLSGSQRPIGHIYSAGPRRMIFLGSLQLGDERQVLPYGIDSRRDMAGIVERVGEQRWRLVFPRPAFESIIDVIELIPA